MGKTKQAKEKKFDRNVEISAPILDPEIIKAIHTPPKGQRIDVKHGGFKALLSDLNSQDSTDELMPLNDNHVPSYIGISCAVSGYSNYSPYNKRPLETTTTTSSSNKTGGLAAPPTNRSRATSPALPKQEPQVHHISIDKRTIQSADQERKELTEKLTASVNEHHRIPSPHIPPTEEDRHHGAYVGARYCPLPEVSKVVNKHIPLLGIDDELDPEKALEEEQKEQKVESKIASLYGDHFVEDWRESQTHKSKKETAEQPAGAAEAATIRNPKDLVTLKPTPPSAAQVESQAEEEPLVPVPNVKVLAQVENKQFLNKLLTDENPPRPSPPSQSPSHSPQPSPTTKSHSNFSPKAAGAAAAVAATAAVAAVAAVADSLATSQEDGKIDDEAKPEPAAPTPSPEPATAQSAEAEHNQLMEKEDVERESQQPESVMEILAAKPDELPPPPPADVAHEEMMAQLSSSLDKPETALTTDSIEAAAEQLEPSGGEEHIEYEIRAQSPVDNESSPVRRAQAGANVVDDVAAVVPQQLEEQKLVSFSPEPQETVAGQQAQGQVVHGDGGPQDGSPRQLKALMEEEEETLDVSDSKDGRHYLGLLDQERSFILEQIARAESQLEATATAADGEEEGRVRSAIGKANLLVNKKFNQFRDLCEANINKSSDEQFATLNDDLAGFWDMLTIQVADVRRSFENLWQEGGGNRGDSCNKQLAASTTTATTVATKDMKPKLSAQRDQERRERLQGHISQMKQHQAKLSAENLLDELAASNESSGELQPIVSPTADCDSVEAAAAAAEMEQQQQAAPTDLLGATTDSADLEPQLDSLAPNLSGGDGGLGALEAEGAAAMVEEAAKHEPEKQQQEEQQQQQQETADLVDFGE